MGKTHRKVSAGSCSVDYNSPHNRGFAKKIKSHSHRSIRTHNNNCNEDEIQTFNCKCKKMNTHWASVYVGKLENISNFKFHFINDEYLNLNYDYKWNKTDENLIDTIDTIINNPINSNENKFKHDPYLNACKKQIERRGNIGRFYTHR